MTIASGIRSGLRSGIRSGLNPGSDPMDSVTRDATSSIYTPLTEAEAETVLEVAGVAAPSVTNLYKFGTPASGNIPDVIGGKTLTASGVWAGYRQVVAGWSLRSLKSNDNSLVTVGNTTYANVNATSYTVFLLARLASAPPLQRTLMKFGDAFDDDACIDVDATPRLRVGEGDATRTVGTANPTGAARYYVLRIDDTANTVAAFTSQEKIAAGVQACNGTTLQFGGNNVNSWPAAACDYMLAFVVAGALTNTEIKAALSTLGESPGWVP